MTTATSTMFHATLGTVFTASSVAGVLGKTSAEEELMRVWELLPKSEKEHTVFSFELTASTGEFFRVVVETLAQAPLF